ncbi:hypothetical protein JXA85_08045 [Candidatus Woesearchaeota archaeon]|nr:hypothetical protein [Candidatus Woesearchaeota archaeon]
MRNKRGSLNLSIEAIVILVMAITMLGLGLAFIKSKFTKTGDLLDSVDENVRESIKQQLATSGEKLYIPKTQFELRNGDSEVAVIGIKNTEGSQKTFEMKVEYIDTTSQSLTICDYKGKEFCPAGDQSTGQAKFTFSREYSDVGPGEIKLIPFKIFVGSNIKKSQMFVFTITESGAVDPYATSQFFVKGI